MKILLAVLLLALSLTDMRCAYSGDSNSRPAVSGDSVGQPVEFQLYSGNESLPPPYQQLLTIRGKIDASDIAVNYTYRDKNGVVKRELKLEGDDYRRYVEMVRQTRVRQEPMAERRVGGGAFDVTLIDAEGKRVTGIPSNRSDWEQFAEAVTEAAKEPTGPK
jgi:hypothetical protein